MDDQRITSPQYLEDQDIEENTLRPKRLSDFIGQDQFKKNLAVFIKAAAQRNDALDHVFLSGPPGLGKTTLAYIISHELGLPIRATSAPALERTGDLAAMLTSIEEKSVFFIDEIHRLKPAVEEILYSAMEDFQIDVVIGQGPGARTLKIPIPPFTLVGATTKAGLVSSPLYSRFGITWRLDFYTVDDIKAVIERSARILECAIHDAATDLLANCSRGTPRVANRLLRRMRDFAQVWAEGAVTEDIVARGLTSLEIDQAGLDKLDRQILDTIIRKYKGGPVGSETIAISVGESVDTLEDIHEPYLIQKGFLQRTPRGRTATEKAYTQLGLPFGHHENQRLLF
jgi:Holliday junction DNA helicase RuvB